VTFTGGGSRNEWWNQLRCDVLGVPVRLPENPEPALGMAVLAAGARTGDIPAAAKRLVRVRRTLEPDMVRHAELTPAYRDFVVALIDRGWWRE
jgi:D-ribulokinase